MIASQPAMLPGHMDRWLTSDGYSMAQQPYGLRGAALAGAEHGVDKLWGVKSPFMRPSAGFSATVTNTGCVCTEGNMRSAIKLDSRPADDAGYEAWIDGLKQGRLYFGDGRSHVQQYSVSGQPSGGEDSAPRTLGVVRCL